ncbi:hypothetical protein [Nonomuraea phyllanthi]|uniref:hypothetical protein n=1 Tax=Nonomuraea phyllanthi TaxID=2219224 RepID=UPI001885368E|nr:hypothetical protein [Nonomuraea phyllanthi]
MPSKGTWTKAAEKSARAACEHLRPLLPPELDPAKNPNYARSVRIEAKCLQDHGFDVHLVKVSGPAKLGWRYASVPGPDVDISRRSRTTAACRLSAAAGRFSQARSSGRIAAVTPGLRASPLPDVSARALDQQFQRPVILAARHRVAQLGRHRAMPQVKITKYGPPARHVAAYSAGARRATDPVP